MASTAFVTLEDIAEYLPSYEESVFEVDMDATLARAYDGIEEDIREALRKHRGNRSLMSLMMHRLLLYPDHPFGIEAIYGNAFNPESKQVEEFFVTDPPDLDESALYPKEVKLIEDIREEIRQGRRCQVYVTFTGEHDVAGGLERILGNAGFRVSVLRPTVPTLKREDWYINQIRAGSRRCHLPSKIGRDGPRPPRVSYAVFLRNRLLPPYFAAGLTEVLAHRAAASRQSEVPCLQENNSNHLPQADGQEDASGSDAGREVFWRRHSLTGC